MCVCTRVCVHVHTVVVQWLSHVQLSGTPWSAARQMSLSFPICRSLLKLMCIELVIASNLLILCHTLLLPSVIPRIRVFSNESALSIRWPEYWSLSIGPSNEYSGLISFRIDWQASFNFMAVVIVHSGFGALENKVCDCSTVAP